MGGGGVTGSELCSQLVDHVRLRLNEQLERLVLLSQLLDFLLDFHALSFDDFSRSGNPPRERLLLDHTVLSRLRIQG